MWSTYQKLWALFDRKGRLAVFGLLLVMLGAAAVEALAVVAVLPLATGLTGATPHAVGASWLVGGQGSHSVGLLAVIFCTAVIAAILLKVLADYGSMHFAWMQNVRWIQRLLRVQLNREYDWYLQRHSAEIGYGLLGRVQDVVSGSLVPALQLLVNVFVVVLILVVLLKTLPVKVLAGVVVMIFIYCCIYIALRRKFLAIGVEKEATSALRFRMVGEIFGGIKDVKLHGLEFAYEARTRVPFERHAILQSQRHLLSMLPRYLFEAIGFTALCLMILLLDGSKLGVSSALPKLGMFGFAAYRLLPAIQQVYANAISLPIGLPALTSLHDELLAGNDDLPTVVTPLYLQQAITLRDVHYAYPDAALSSTNGVNLSIPACSMIALVGKSGAGKSTLADLAIGLLAPTAGQLVIDGKVLDSCGRRAWRANCAYVPQQVFLLDDSIAANIAFGVPEHLWDNAKIAAAAQGAALHAFIVDALPEGYATKIGERGVRLSGGQRQRIGIARALYRDADFLVLDEATNALDSGTEAEVMQALERLHGSKTILVIAHRLSTVERCDRVLLIEDGRIIADGTYTDLLRTNASFRHFANVGDIDGTVNATHVRPEVLP